MPSSGTLVVTEEVVEVLDLLEVDEVGEGPAEQLKPRNLATTRDLMLPLLGLREATATSIEGSSGNRKREIKVDTAIP